jgi:hypothetical protein
MRNIDGLDQFLEVEKMESINSQDHPDLEIKGPYSPGI